MRPPALPAHFAADATALRQGCHSIHCEPMPAAFTTCAHFSISLLNSVLNSVGVVPAGSTPRALKRSCIAGDFTIRLTSAEILATTFPGVPRGAKNPYQTSTSYPGTPASSSVGTSGKDGERLRPLVPSGLTLPALIIGNCTGIPPR